MRPQLSATTLAVPSRPALRRRRAEFQSIVRWLTIFLVTILTLMATAVAQQTTKDLSDASLEELSNIQVYSASKHMQSAQRRARPPLPSSPPTRFRNTATATWPTFCAVCPASMSPTTAITLSSVCAGLDAWETGTAGFWYSSTAIASTITFSARPCWEMSFWWTWT